MKMKIELNKFFRIQFFYFILFDISFEKPPSIEHKKHLVTLTQTNKLRTHTVFSYTITCSLMCSSGGALQMATCYSVYLKH